MRSCIFYSYNEAYNYSEFADNCFIIRLGYVTLRRFMHNKIFTVKLMLLKDGEHGGIYCICQH